MGRFASTVEFYTRFREQYPAEFFRSIAQRIGLTGDEQLLDVGCGPAPLAIGFAPFVRSCSGVDPEAAMIAAAKEAAAEAGVALSLTHGRIEEFTSEHKFDIVTIGRAIHWMDRDSAVRVLEEITVDGGHVVICGASSAETDGSPWVKPYDVVRRRRAMGPEEKRYRLDSKLWFEGSQFEVMDSVSVSEGLEVTIEELIGRALSKSNTSPEVLGAQRAEFESEIAAVLKPFAHEGKLLDRVVAQATIFVRKGR